MARTLALPEVTPGSPAGRDEIWTAVKGLWPHFAAAGAFSCVINLLYLSSPLYLMQVYNRVLVSENVPTLVLLTIILALALLTMAVLDAVRAQVLIRCGIKLDAVLPAAYSMRSSRNPPATAPRAARSCCGTSTSSARF